MKEKLRRKRKEKNPKERSRKQGRIHGQYQLRMGGQGRKCAFSHFPTRSDDHHDGRTDGPMDGHSLL